MLISWEILECIREAKTTEEFICKPLCLDGSYNYFLCLSHFTQHTAQKSSQAILDGFVASDLGAQDVTSAGWAVFAVLMLETIIFARRTKHFQLPDFGVPL